MTGDISRDRSPVLRLTGLGRDDFGDRFWGQQLHHATADTTAGLGTLFSLAAADELIAHRGLRTPFLRLVRDAKAIPNSRFTAGGGVGATINDQVHDAKVRRLFADGATLVFQGLQRTWQPIGDFTRELAGELGHPVQANAYITPPQSQGFSDHYDVHDVFVVQLHGDKAWSIHAPVHPYPLRDQPWDDRREEVRLAAAQAPLASLTLSPGDCLYLPRGFIHSARALGGITAHLTIGVHTWNRHNLAEAVLDEALAGLAEDPATRRSLRLGARVEDPVDIADDVDRVKAELMAAIDAVPVERIAAAMEKRMRGAMRADPVSVFGGATSAFEDANRDAEEGLLDDYRAR